MQRLGRSSANISDKRIDKIVAQQGNLTPLDTVLSPNDLVDLCSTSMLSTENVKRSMPA